MSLKDLFNKEINKNKTKGSTGLINLSQFPEDVESADYAKEKLETKKSFTPFVDFSEPKNFAKYGSAKQYYKDSFSRILNSYPYDGSAYEKQQWINSSSYIDVHVFENEYPRTYGYANFGRNGTFAGATAAEGWRQYGSHEFIFVKGGPNYNNVFDTGSKRGSNLELNLNNGVTVEFWLKSDPSTDDQSAKQCVFDLWNSGSFTSSDYGRFRIEFRKSFGSTNADRFWVELRSGSNQDPHGVYDCELSGSGIGTLPITSSSWHHYAITAKNSGTNLSFGLYVDGQCTTNSLITGSSIGPITGALNATIGALHTSVSGTHGALGWGKLSGSIDDFRYWKTARNAKQIARNYFTQVYGGTNVVDSNTTLGVYYKFNEVGNIVLDYSGRVSNGQWQGYVERFTDQNKNSRVTGSSAMILSSASLDEFKDPIMYETHTEVASKLNSLELIGAQYDANNMANLYNSFPSWIVEEDSKSGEQLLKLTQVIAGYFDKLYLQTQAINEIKDIKYTTSGSLPISMMKKVISAHGMNAPDLFIDTEIFEALSSRDEKRIFEQEFEKVKDLIYKNIYNNLLFIHKSKGTEKSFRNLFRCYGVDDDLFRLNIYSDNSEFSFDKHRVRTSIQTKKYINFDGRNLATASILHPYPTRNMGAVIYQMTASNSPESVSYISSSGYPLNEQEDEPIELGTSRTAEVNVFFPKPIPHGDENWVEFPTGLDGTKLTSSIFGFSSAVSASHSPAGVVNFDGDTKWSSMNAAANKPQARSLFAVRDTANSKKAKFVFSPTNSTWGAPVETDEYYDVYDDVSWTFAHRVRPEKDIKSHFVSGTFDLDTGGGSQYVEEIYGVQRVDGETLNEFHISASSIPATEVFKGSQRWYVGATRNNHTGTLLYPSDVRIGSLRVWADYLDDDEIKYHADDPLNFGRLRPFESAYTFVTGANSVSPVHKTFVPKAGTLLLNWDFETLTTASTTGVFIVQDLSSGSAKNVELYGEIGNIISKQHTGVGYGFAASKPNVTTEYIHSTKTQAPENISDKNTIQSLEFDDIFFTKDTRPINYFYSFESSPYSIISDEIMDMFASIVSFNNMVGEPVNRYRRKYKSLEMLRSLFFKNVKTNPDVDRFLTYYKWLDNSISYMISDLFPASANASHHIRNVIESHVLERNKYQNKLPTLEYKIKEIEGGVENTSQLNSWKFCHAPTPPKDGTVEESDNCCWWFTKAERNHPVLTTVGSMPPGSLADSTDVSRQKILNTVLTASNRGLSGQFKLNADIQFPIVGGYQEVNKKRFIYKDIPLDKNSTSHLYNSGETLYISNPSTVQQQKACDDVIDPNEKLKVADALVLVTDKEAFSVKATFPDVAASNVLAKYGNANSKRVSPYTLFWTAKGTDPSAKIERRNLNQDSYTVGIFNEVPVQGTFTEVHVGGLPNRHVLPLTPSGSRVEGYVSPSPNNNLYLMNPFSLNINSPRGDFYRDGMVKRHINVTNIKTITGSTMTVVDSHKNYEYVASTLGNYSKNYEIVNTSGRTKNNLYFVSNSGITQTYAESPYFSGVIDFALPVREKSGKRTESVFVERFNAPGGPDVSSRGVLDPIAEEFAVNNAITYRNLAVRQPLQQLLTAHSLQFGLYSGDVSPPTASFHKVNRNSRLRIEAQSGPSTVITGTRRDNYYVQHAIPASELGYAWVTASAISAPFGYSLPYYANGKGTAYSSTGSIIVISGSDFGSYSKLTNSTKKAWGTSVNNEDQFLAGDFVGLANHVYDPVTSSHNYLGYKLADGVPLDSTTAGALQYQNNDTLTTVAGLADTIPHPGKSAAYLFNALMLNRNGPYQHPMWKQIRNGDHKVVRQHKKENIISIFKEGIADSTQIVHNTDPMGMPYFGTIKKKSSLFNVIEPPVTSKYHSLTHSFDTSISDIFNESLTTIVHSYGNNKEYFANSSLNNLSKLHFKSVGKKQIYDTLLKLYAYDGDVSLPYKPKQFLSFSYPETIYPKAENTYLARTRGREKFEFPWRDKKQDRFKELVQTSVNTIIPTASIWPLDGHNVPYDIEYQAGIYTGSVNDGYGAGELLSFDHTSSVITPKYRRYTVAANRPAWTVGDQVGVNPHFDNYEKFSNDPRFIAKDFSVVPEFRISQLIGDYVDFHNSNFLTNDITNTSNLFELTGTIESGSLGDEFGDKYLTSDPLKYATVFQTTHGSPTSMKISCDAVVKLNPYKGFYPAERTAQIAAMFSASMAPDTVVTGAVMPEIFGQGTTEAATDITIAGLTGSFHTMMRPFFAPGILYNSIKSGIAVDYLVQSPLYKTDGSGRVTKYYDVSIVDPQYDPLPQGGLLFASNIQGKQGHDAMPDGVNVGTPHKRIPFEALLDPSQEIKNFPISDSEYVEGHVFYGSKGEANEQGHTLKHLATAMYEGSGISPMYKSAMKNFLAETKNIFMDSRGAGFTSKSHMGGFEFNSSGSYAMRVSLEQTNNHIMYGDSSAFGPRILWSSGSTAFTNSVVNMASHSTASFMAFTPPYFYGSAFVDLEVNVKKATTLSINQIFTILTASYGLTGSAKTNSSHIDTMINPYDWYNKNTGAYEAIGMKISSSVNLFQALPVPEIEYAFNPLDEFFRAGNNPHTAAGRNLIEKEATRILSEDPSDPLTVPYQSTFDPEQESLKSLGIHPSVIAPGSVGNYKWKIAPKFEFPVMNFKNVSALTGTHRGMWHQFGDYGEYDSSTLQKAPWADVPRGSEAGIFLSIQDVPVTSSFNETYNQQSEKKSLADIVGFPKTSHRVGKLNSGFTMSEAVVAIPYTVVNGVKKFYDLPTDPTTGLVKTTRATTAMMEKMKKYVIPPRFDFLKTVSGPTVPKNLAEIKPIIMYMFEFSVDLTKEDLARIWQNTMPDASLTPESNQFIQKKTISHSFGPTSLVESYSHDTKWMVFKVKQRSKTNSVSNNDDELLYNYNWPYDYVSLVELAKIKLEFEYTNIKGAKPIVGRGQSKVPVHNNSVAIPITYTDDPVSSLPPGDLPGSGDVDKPTEAGPPEEAYEEID